MSRDNNLTKNQLRGIDLVVKSVAKKYPFVKGWTFDPTWKTFEAHLYIDLYVDWDEVSKFYDVKFKPYYEDVKDKKPLDNTSAILSFFGTYEWDSPEQQAHFEKSYNSGVKLKNLIKSLYQSLPEDFQVYYNHGTSFPTKSLCSLDINHYVDNRKQE